jgi:formylglycine-generating enzyme required for sulfatase activity|nr:SUMF1/EgtB/PvdO family nonheme iron enzyme [Kofleriaceae bacterium]
MIAIPAGAYIAGSTRAERDRAYDDYLATAHADTARAQHWFEREAPRHTAELPAFRVDATPVTNAAYAEFVAATGTPPPAITAAAWAAQHLAQDYDREVARFVWPSATPPAGRGDHPVVLVTHAEAAAYCAWRGGRRLPTADEFEKAARGRAGRVYPWGDDYDAARLDSAVAGPRDTAPVGSFPAGASPYGVLDLAGDVFEWTATPFTADASKFTVKGAAWDDFGGVGRGAALHGRPATLRHAIVGFRCAADGAADGAAR